MIDLVHARLIKLATLPDGEVSPFGARGTGPIKPGYEVYGFYADVPVSGAPFVMTRYKTQGVNAPGYFATSYVKDVRLVEGAIEFTTMNSQYRLEPILP